LRKDFSFSINLNDPSKTEQESAPLKEEVRQRKTSKKESPITVNHEIAKANGTSLFDMLPSISFGGTETKKEKKELAVVSESTREAYISRFAKVAVNERKKFGIPASIIVANGLLHSFSGILDCPVRLIGEEKVRLIMMPVIDTMKIPGPVFGITAFI